MSWLAAALPVATSLAGGIINRNEQRDINQKNLDAQREFAQQGIRWRVEDAKAAGLHPLAALGASGASGGAAAVGDTSMGNAVANMGQDISRAINKTRTQSESEVAKLQLAHAQANLDGQVLENQYKAYKLKQLTNPNPMPDAVDHSPAKRTMTNPNLPHQQVSDVADYGFVRTPGGLAPVPSTDAKERIEDQALPETMWAIRNQLVPNFPWTEAARKHRPSTKDYPLPKGYAWKWNMLTQQYEPSTYKTERPNKWAPHRK